MDLATIVLTSCITVFSLGMFLVSLISFRTYKNVKLLFVCVAFFVFFIKGIVQSMSLFSSEVTFMRPDFFSGLFDMVILILLFMATLKR